MNYIVHVHVHAVFPQRVVAWHLFHWPLCFIISLIKHYMYVWLVHSSTLNIYPGGNTVYNVHVYMYSSSIKYMYIKYVHIHVCIPAYTCMYHMYSSRIKYIKYVYVHIHVYTCTLCMYRMYSSSIKYVKYMYIPEWEITVLQCSLEHQN